MDDFLVTVRLADGTARSIRREGDTPKIEITNPLARHDALLGVLHEQERAGRHRISRDPQMMLKRLIAVLGTPVPADRDRGAGAWDRSGGAAEAAR